MVWGVSIGKSCLQWFCRAVSKPQLQAMQTCSREFFQGRNAKGSMKARSEDEPYNAHIETLREKLGIFTKKIQLKVSERLIEGISLCVASEQTSLRQGY
jgi:hypothetical protein